MNLQELKVIQWIAEKTKERFSCIQGMSFGNLASFVNLRPRISKACNPSVYRGTRLFKTKQ